jgi:hypothetical protein
MSDLAAATRWFQQCAEVRRYIGPHDAHGTPVEAAEALRWGCTICIQFHPELESVWFQPLSLYSGILISCLQAVAFKFNLHRYTVVLSRCASAAGAPDGVLQR